MTPFSQQGNRMKFLRILNDAGCDFSFKNKILATWRVISQKACGGEGCRMGLPIKNVESTTRICDMLWLELANMLKIIEKFHAIALIALA